ncbi:MAG: ATP-binding protein, partial [Bacteroidota bacterium]
YLKYLFESFQSLADQKHIDLRFESNVEALQMDFDPDYLMQVINNLMSNAIKFTPEQGHVFFRVQKASSKTLSISIEDSGIGIPQEKIPKIFDRFYQVDNTDTRVEGGTGIGLTLTKELVELMGGKIQVESVPQKHSVFTITLPIWNKAETLITEEHFSTATIEKSVAPKVGNMVDSASQKPSILIVEDNADVIHYMTTILSRDFQLEIAFNGLEGLERARKVIPDLVLTDLMMPQQNGYELCYKLKTHALTGHIPIIMLTAKADTASRLTGFKKGADDYLTKPFLPQELKIRINNLLEQRKRLMAFYQKNIGLPLNGKINNGYAKAPEDAFLKDLNVLIEEHLQNPDLDVTLLESKLLVSHSSLYRKVKALTDLSPQQYIRAYRLGRASNLLSTTKLSISEIAYETGFRDPDYFTRVFKKEQGVSPTIYRNNYKM